MAVTRRATRPLASNILDVYRDATVREQSEGRDWYADAHALAVKLDPENPARAAGVLAALSPQTGWGRNVRLAARAYADGYASGTLGRSVRAADAILAGADPDSVLRGPKVNAFYRSIADPTDVEPVVIDRHAFDIAVGRETGDVAREQLTRVGQYERWARAYRRAARTITEETGIDTTAAQVQAITWLAWRRRKGLRGPQITVTQDTPVSVRTS